MKNMGLKPYGRVGKRHELTGILIHSESNYDNAVADDLPGWVSCNTTGL